MLGGVGRLMYIQYCDLPGGHCYGWISPPKIQDACLPGSWKEVEGVNLSFEGVDEITGILLDFVKSHLVHFVVDHQFREYLLPLPATWSKSKYVLCMFFLIDFLSLMRSNESGQRMNCKFDPEILSVQYFCMNYKQIWIVWLM